MDTNLQEDARRILVVDDEPKILEAIVGVLAANGFQVDAAQDGSSALKQFRERRPDLIVLDLLLPDISGQEICQKVRLESSVPIIMLTALADETDVLHGLDIGADDYMTKPFSPRELLSRVRVILRRAAGSSQLLANRVSLDGGRLTIDLLLSEVQVNGELVTLTMSEYRVLSTMLRQPKKIFTREELIEIAFGRDYEGYERIIDTHIKNLRQKIEPDRRNPRYILTVHGLGYRFGGNDRAT